MGFIFWLHVFLLHPLLTELKRKESKPVAHQLIYDIIISYFTRNEIELEVVK